MISGFVYFIRFGRTHFYKIGFTRNIHSRLNALDQIMPLPIELIASHQSASAPEIETQLHIKYAKYRQRGEWFKFTKKEVDDLASAFHANKCRMDNLFLFPCAS